MKQNRIQDLRALEARIFEAAEKATEEASLYGLSDRYGIAVNSRDYSVQVCTQDEATTLGLEFRPLSSLESDGHCPDYDLVADMAAEYCFVR